ncbi:uncharacterized protein LOC104887483 [Beta vulgaris subsp. vulgaris]|uniref:uncharacterized protein LOC104887483 n=1 Tax=Beta vulgaris subsp. vulgaris TaxID=3555 RepID=UPI00053FEC2E|nr:uncharacterized protein LOC104887483 [Beta vulgaris subsp. vulgaris]
MEESQSITVTSSSLVDTPAPEDAEAGALTTADFSGCHGGSSLDDETWLTDCDEETEAFYLDREGKRRREEFYNAGYRDGVAAGKIDAAQDGFNQGFKDSVMVGYKWGITRGVTSALAHIPNELQLKLVETEEKRKEFINLYEAVDSIETGDALNLFSHTIQRRASAERTSNLESDSSITPSSNSEHSDLESYFGKLELLLTESPVIDVQLELDKNRVF